MAVTRSLPVKNLHLDLRNFRTVPQKNELSALHTMITINPDRFWALMDSLLDTGYLPTENVIVLVDKKGTFHVREGNRRIGALKLAHKYLSRAGLSIPKDIETKINGLAPSWKKSNTEVPCAIYNEKEEAVVDKIVTLAHGKGEKAGRDNWTSVARARHNRDKNGGSELGLDLLEKYLDNGKNLTTTEREKWSGDYPLTVLDEAISKLSPRLAFSSQKDLVKQYPSIKLRNEMEDILKRIGNEQLGFDSIRSKIQDFAAPYGIAPLPPKPLKSLKPSGGSVTSRPSLAPALVGSKRVAKAIASNDPRSVKLVLKSLTPRGKGRNKVVLLRDEALQLNLDNQPHAFCFVLRAMFEVSAKAYCNDHAADKLSFQKSDGSDKQLANVLREIVAHLTAGKIKTDPLTKSLHGAMTELGKPEGLLSVTSLNQLIHSPDFIVDSKHICTVFSNIFPLLKEMN